MGLFDKLRDVADVAKNSLDKAAAVANQAIESAQSAADPLSDPEIKQYFQIACGMRQNFYECLDVLDFIEYPKFKKYADYILGKDCNEEKLEKALELYKIARGYHSTPKEKKLSNTLNNFRAESERSNVYKLDPYVTCKVCCQKEIAEFTAKYERILSVIEDDVSYTNFDKGVHRLIGKNSLGQNKKFDECLVQIVVANSFCAGNPVTQEIVLGIIRDNIGAITNAERFIDTASLLTLKALHFENYSGDKENYTTITKEEVCDFVQSETHYKEQIDKQLFDKDEYIDMLADRVVNANIFERPTSAWGYFGPDYVDHYYCDMICNLLWKESANSRDWTINGEQINQSTDPVIAMKIVANYFAENR